MRKTTALRRVLSLLLALLLSGMLLNASAQEVFSDFPEPGEETESAETEEETETVVQGDAQPEVTETPIDEGVRPEFVRMLLDTAIAEIGYTEGRNNYSKYGEWMGDANAAWCAEFICWCVHQVDEAQGTNLLESVYPRYSGQNTGRDWYITRGRFCYRKGNCPDWGYQWLKGSDHYLVKNEFIPRSGDLVFFSYNEAGDTEHVALVEYCASTPDGEIYIHVIEGNNPDRVQRNTYKLNNSQVLGFGLCEDVIDTQMHVGNRGDKVLLLQQKLNALGLLAEKHMTGGYGSNTKQAVSTFQSEWMEEKTATGAADRETQQAIEAAYDKMIDESPDSWMVVD